MQSYLLRGTYKSILRVFENIEACEQIKVVGAHCNSFWAYIGQNVPRQSGVFWVH